MALNKNNSAVKRIMQEARELANDPCTDYSAAPLEDDIFEWHCTLRGPSGTEFEGGLYHFRILLPAEYPFRPPSIMILTPNGRFELNTKICISFTSYHEELWQPAWGVRTAIIGLQGFFPLKGQAAVGVGSIEYPASERRRLAALSRDWTCPHCQQTNLELLPDPPQSEAISTPEEPQLSPSQPNPIPSTTNSNEIEHSPNPTSIELPSTQTSEPAVEPTVTTPLDISQTPQSVATEDKEISAPSRNIISPTQSTATEPPALVVSSPSPVLLQTTPATTHTVQNARRHQISQKPPLLLDSAICVLVVVVFTIICRRIV